jgi:hypothetical protein
VEYDATLTAIACAALSPVDRAAFEAAADRDLESFRATMPPETYKKARQAAVERLVRERAGLPVVSFG